MTFTDDDFKRLEDMKTKYQYFNFPTAWDVNEAYDLIKALLARLEAAENAVENCWDELACFPNCVEHSDCRAYWEWRKAAGK